MVSELWPSHPMNLEIRNLVIILLSKISLPKNSVLPLTWWQRQQSMVTIQSQSSHGQKIIQMVPDFCSILSNGWELLIITLGLHRCWRPNVLVKRFGCWWSDLSPTSRVRHQHHILAYYDVGDRRKSLRICLKMKMSYWNVTNILKWSPSLSHQHNDVTNITITL